MRKQNKARSKIPKREPLRKSVTLNISEIAFSKMVGLVHMEEGEVGWHATVKRADERTFTVEEIYVYPQKAGAASVDTDRLEYESWLMTQEDAVFNNLRMHGHSHVNFGVQPSSKDDSHRAKIVEKLTGDMFYIFMIWNKRLKYHVLIYDCKPRLLYCNDTVEVYVMMDGERYHIEALTSGLIKELLEKDGIGVFLSTPKNVIQSACQQTQWGIML